MLSRSSDSRTGTGFRQTIEGFIKSPTLPFLSAPSSNRMDSNLPSPSVQTISGLSKETGKVPGLPNNDKGIAGNVQEVLNHEELEILAKIEMQNRLLEADSKSLKSVASERSSMSRKNSNGSLSPTSALQPYPVSAGAESSEGSSNEFVDKSCILWGKIISDWEDYRKRNGKQLKEIIRVGIPNHFRSLAWQLLCNTAGSAHQSKYGELIKQSSPSEKLIRRDIARTYPEQDFFKDKAGAGQETLFNVIKAYSLIDKEVGYCQGSAFIVGLLLMQLPEEEAFAVFVTLMEEYRLRELYKPSMAELGLCMYQLENMLQDHAPELMIHFQAQAFHTSMFASSWFLTLFASTFNLSLASRIMDVFISEGMEIIFRIGLAMLLGSEQTLMKMDMEGMLKFIQKDLTNLYNKDPDLLFQKAYALVKYNSKKMKKLKKDYMVMRSKEQEEQVEIRRLNTENRLLRQRLDALEKENMSLADKLIQDRVNRALEAEEKIIMGKELSIAKRQAKLSQTGSLSSAVLEYEVQSDAAESIDQYSDTFVFHLQQELVQAKLREAELTLSVTDLEDKVCDVKERNRELTDQSRVTALQDELISVKLREAELNGAMKELVQKLHSLEDSWQKHLNRTTATRRNVIQTGGKVGKAALHELQEELISARFREAKLSTQLNETSQKLSEVETANKIISGQLGRAEDERALLQEKYRVVDDRERLIQQQLNEATARVAHAESKKQEAVISLRIKEADNVMKIAELQQEISKLKMQNADSAASDAKEATIECPDSTRIISQLQRKILKQQRVIGGLQRNGCGGDSGGVADASSEYDSDDSDLVFDATVVADEADDVAVVDDAVVANDAAVVDEADDAVVANVAPGHVCDEQNCNPGDESSTAATADES